VSFRANDRISSEVVMGDNSAYGIAERYAVYSTQDGNNKDYLFAPKLTPQLMKELLKPHINPNKKPFNLEFDLNNSAIQCKPAKAYKKPILIPEEIKNTTTSYPTIKIADYEEVG
jgi:hypothetical protein